MQCSKWKIAEEDEQMKTRACLFLSHVPKSAVPRGSQAAQFQGKLKADLGWSNRNGDFEPEG